MTQAIYFVVIPYLAFVLAVAAGLYRYFTDRFSFSSISSQFLENRALFWGSVPWHYGIVPILIMHVMEAALPDALMVIHRNPTFMVLLNIIGLALGNFTVAGIVTLLMRRVLNPEIRVVTSIMDWILIIALLLQVTAGVYISIFYRWGGMWYIYTASPWLASLASLAPEIDYIYPLPWIVKFHAVNAFVLIGLFPFTRLVHIFTVPITYFWRPYQVVIWNRGPFKK